MSIKDAVLGFFQDVTRVPPEFLEEIPGCRCTSCGEEISHALTIDVCKYICFPCYDRFTNKGYGKKAKSFNESMEMLRNTLRGSVRRTATELKAMEEIANNLRRFQLEVIDKEELLISFPLDPSTGINLSGATATGIIFHPEKEYEPYVERIYIDPNDEDKMNELNAQKFRAVMGTYEFGLIEMRREVDCDG